MSTLSRMIARPGDRDEEALKLLERSVELAREAPIERQEIETGDKTRDPTLVSNVPREQAVQGAYLLLAAFHYDRERFEKAIEVLEEGVEASEYKIELIYQMARLYRVEGLTEQEDALIRRATKESPDSFAAQLVL